MSTRIGFITEGDIDDILIAPLPERIARERAEFTWPTMPADLGEIIPLRKRGHGGVLEGVRRVVNYLKQYPRPDHAFYVVLLDRRTRHIQREVRRLIAGTHLFVIGIAIEEIEAWWLADRSNTLAWIGLRGEAQGQLEYLREGYSPERDQDPKRTLDELTNASPVLERRYGRGNAGLASEFAERYWSDRADLAAIEMGCPRGFAPFCNDVTERLSREKRVRRRRGH
jgi:hypothetical protein